MPITTQGIKFENDSNKQRFYINHNIIIYFYYSLQLSILIIVLFLYLSIVLYYDSQFTYKPNYQQHHINNYNYHNICILKKIHYEYYVS